MFKKILLVGAIASLASSAALANTASPYVGASVGIVNNTVNVKANNVNDATLGSYRGVPFKLFAGYGGVLSQNFYLAGEVFGTVGTADISNNSGLKTSYDYGISILPGVMLSDHTLAYVRAGVLRAHFTGGSRDQYESGGRNGLQAGFGMQTSLTQNVDLRAEYDFVAYQQIKQTVNSQTITLNPRSDQVALGLVYKFD